MNEGPFSDYKPIIAKKSKMAAKIQDGCRKGISRSNQYQIYFARTPINTLIITIYSKNS